MKPASCFAANLGKRTQMAKVGGGSNLTLLEILGPAELGEQRELEEGTQGQPGREPVAFLICPNFSSHSSAQQPGSFFPSAPPSPLAQLRLTAHILTSSWLPSGSPAASSLWEGSFLCPPVFGLGLLLLLSPPPPPAPLAISGGFPPTEPLRESPPHPRPDSVFRCQLCSNPGPLEYYFS